MRAAIEFLEEYRNKQIPIKDFPAEITGIYHVIACLKTVESKQVYLLQRKTDHKKYILKIVDSKSHENLETEYELHSSLSHIGLVPAIQFIRTEDKSYFIREYVEGTTVTELVEMSREGYLTDELILSVLLQLCDILIYLHHQNPPVIHRDIKPDNVLITNQHTCVLIDFGISRRYHGYQEKDTVIMGTEFTAPPEQFGFKQTDARSDIYSMGVLMFYMATGSLNLMDIEQYQISYPIKKIIKRCTEFSPDDRFSSVEQLMTRIQHYRRLHSNKRKAWIVGGTTFMLTGCFILGIYLFNQSKNGTRDFLVIPSELNQLSISVDYGSSEDDATKEAMTQITETQELYVFQSSLIEAAVRHELGKSETDSITLRELNNIEELYLCGQQVYDRWDDHFVYGKMQYMKVAEYNRTGLFLNQGNIANLEDLKLMKNLKILALYNQQINDISPLIELENLYCLGLGTNDINDISGLSELSNLRQLDLSGNPVNNRDIIHLNKLSALETLDLGETNVTDLSNIVDLPIKTLALWGTKVMDCNNIDSFKNLTKLIISGIGNGITKEGLHQVVKLKNLKELRLMGGQLEDIRLLNQLENLTYLELCGIDINSLEGLDGTKLTSLYLDYSRINNLNPLTKMTNLYQISVTNIPCEDFTPLAELPDLSEVICSKEQIAMIREQLDKTGISVVSY